MDPNSNGSVQDKLPSKIQEMRIDFREQGAPWSGALSWLHVCESKQGAEELGLGGEEGSALKTWPSKKSRAPGLISLCGDYSSASASSRSRSASLPVPWQPGSLPLFRRSPWGPENCHMLLFISLTWVWPKPTESNQKKFGGCSQALYSYWEAEGNRSGCRGCVGKEQAVVVWPEHLQGILSHKGGGHDSY